MAKTVWGARIFYAVECTAGKPLTLFFDIIVSLSFFSNTFKYCKKMFSDIKKKNTKSRLFWHKTTFISIIYSNNILRR